MSILGHMPKRVYVIMAKILVFTEMLAGRGQVKYSAMPEVIRKNEVGLRAVTSSGCIGTPPACFMSRAKKVNTREHASKMYGDYTKCMQRLPFRKRNSRYIAKGWVFCISHTILF